MQLSLEQPMSLQKFDDEFWTSGQTAEFLNVSVSWLAKARVSGGGPDYVKFGRAVRYSKNSVVRYAKSRTHRSTSEYEMNKPGVENDDFGRTDAEPQSQRR